MVNSNNTIRDNDGVVQWKFIIVYTLLLLNILILFISLNLPTSPTHLSLKSLSNNTLKFSIQ
jgi:hypothetical protein